MNFTYILAAGISPCSFLAEFQSGQLNMYIGPVRICIYIYCTNRICVCIYILGMVQNIMDTISNVRSLKLL